MSFVKISLKETLIDAEVADLIPGLSFDDENDIVSKIGRYGITS